MKYNKLLDIASEALGAAVAFNPKPGVQGQWLDLMSARNGFYAFEGALLVRPAIQGCMGVSDAKFWNSADGWKSHYICGTHGLFMFAEDVFGEQYGYTNDGIYKFDPESGDTEQIATTFVEWSTLMTDEYNYYCGHQIAHDWQVANGKLVNGCRLVPKVPFVLGGEYDHRQMFTVHESKYMLIRAALANKLYGAKDGEIITFCYDECRAC
jgi:hypothetical protein